MAALNRPTEANYEVHENVTVDTQDNEDHTFCGIMFPIKAKQDLPVTKIFLHSVAVRGRLGPLTVWVTKPHFRPAQDSRDYRFPLQSRHWQKIYEQTHAPSMRKYQWLDFSDHPIELDPGQVRAIYIHSTAQGDEAIVYDNATVRPHWQYQVAGRPLTASTPPRYQDAFVSLHTGKAHLSPRPFGQTPIWGWGNSWRDHREFVGQVRYGVRYQLWQPVLTGTKYGPAFRTAVQTLLGCQRRLESPMAHLPDECLYYIINMCRWDWWNDQSAELQAQRRRLRRKALEQDAQPDSPAIAAQPPTDDTVRQVSDVSERMEESQREEDEDEEDHDEEMDGEEEEEADSDAEEWQEEDSDSDGSAWENGYRADPQVFAFRDASSDEESDDSEEDPEVVAAERQAWFRRRFARIHILRALAQAGAGNDVVMRVGGSNSSDEENDEVAEEEEEEETTEEHYAALVDTDED